MSTASDRPRLGTLRLIPRAEYNPLVDAPPEVESALEAYRIALMAARRAHREWRADEESPAARAAMRDTGRVFDAARLVLDAILACQPVRKAWWVCRGYVACLQFQDEVPSARWAPLNGVVDVEYCHRASPIGARPAWADLD